MAQRPEPMVHNCSFMAPPIVHHIFVNGDKHVHTELDNLPTLDALARDGCTPAERFAKGVRLAVVVNTLLQDTSREDFLSNVENVADRIVIDIAGAVKIDSRIPEWDPEIKRFVETICAMVFDRMSKELREERSPLDRAAHICRVYFKSFTDYDRCIKFIDEGLQKYSDEEYFYFTKACMLGFQQNFRDSLKLSEEALKIFPRSRDLMFTKASCMRSPCTKRSLNDRIEAHKAMLSHSHISDRDVPHFYFELASFYGDQLKLINMQPEYRSEFLRLYKCLRKSFKNGKESEKHILSFNLEDEHKYYPWKCLVSETIKRIRKNEGAYFKKISEKENQCKRAIPIPEQRKGQLNDSWRVELVTAHRRLFSEINKNANFRPEGYVCWVKSNELEKSTDFYKGDIKEFKSIVLIELDYEQEKTYTGRIIELKSLEPIVVIGKTVELLVEDADGDTQKCIINTQGLVNGTLEEIFGIGCKFSVIHPHLQPQTNNLDGKPFIRVSKLSTVIQHPEQRLDGMCRYCATANCSKHCNKCKMAFYCDRDCQLKDWNIFLHRIICVE